MSLWFAQKSGDYFRFPTKEEFRANVPPMFTEEGEDIPNDGKFYCGWQVASIAWTWLIAQYDYEKNIAYGYVSFGDRNKTDLGVIVIEDLKELFDLRRPCPLTDDFVNGPINFFYGFGLALKVINERDLRMVLVKKGSIKDDDVDVEYHICALCGDRCGKYGNDPSPVCTTGLCCC